MNTGLEYSLALRMRSATRWVEGQQGIPSSDDEGTVDGFGRMMLVRTGSLPTGYTGAMGVPGTTIDQGPTGVNTAGVAVLIKDFNGGQLATNTTYSARLAGYDAGKAMYLVDKGATSVRGGKTQGTFSSTGTYVMGDDGVQYKVDESAGSGFVRGAWWNSLTGLSCTFVGFGPFKENVRILRMENYILFGTAKLNLSTGSSFNYYYDLYNESSRYTYGNVLAKATDPLGLAAHMTVNRKINTSFPPTNQGVTFRAASLLRYGELEGKIIAVSSFGWPGTAGDPIDAVGYSPFWDGYKSTAPMSQPL